MKLANQETTKTRAKYTVTAESDDLNKYTNYVTSSFKGSVKVPGFRPGKAPSEMILKYADQDKLQNEFLNYAVNDLYVESQETIKHRVVGQPEISVQKFVPFTALEISVEVPIVSDIKLPKYSGLKFTKASSMVTKQQIDSNIKELQKRSAAFKPVKRPAKAGDLVVIDFDGTDFKTKEDLPLAGAKDYRLILGEGTLIPGFEDKLIGLSSGKSKTFTLTFPKDYHDKSFAQRKVNFKVQVKAVNSVELPVLNNDFAKSMGPFKTLTELKDELKKQLKSENERQVTIDLENRILNTLAEKTVVELDERLIQSETNLLLDNAKQSAVNRGQTWKEFLASRAQTEDQYLKELREAAVIRIRGGLAIGEIAEKENISVAETELTQNIENLKTQYTDPAMQAELDNPNNRRELAMRLLTEKVLDFIQKQ